MVYRDNLEAAEKRVQTKPSIFRGGKKLPPILARDSKTFKAYAKSIPVVGNSIKEKKDSIIKKIKNVNFSARSTPIPHISIKTGNKGSRANTKLQEQLKKSAIRKTISKVRNYPLN